MEVKYIGTAYIDYIAYDDGSAFATTPCVVLYSKSTKRYYKAAVEQSVSGDNTEFQFTFSASQTDTILPGVYSLEIYDNDDMENMLLRRDNYIRYEYAATSSTSIPEQSESES